VNYYFNWLGSEDSGSFEYMDESKYNGKLPGPVTLKKPAVIGTEILLTCFECENAVSYQILTGSSASKLTTLGDALSDPPSEPIIVPKDDKYWTIRVTDKYATTYFCRSCCFYTNHDLCHIINPVSIKLMEIQQHNMVVLLTMDM